MRLAEIAEHIAAANFIDSEATHIRLRNPLMKGLLNAEPGRSRNSPADYRPEELARARLLMALQDSGFSTAELAIVNRALNEPVQIVEPRPASMGKPGGIRPNALRCIIRGARQGEAWHIAARVIRTDQGQREVAAFVDAGPMAVDADRSRAVAALDMVNGDTTLAYIFCPASDLIRPLLHLIPEAE